MRSAFVDQPCRAMGGERTLAGVEHPPAVLLLGEGRAGREEDGAAGPLHGLVELALGEAHRVREREDDRARVERGHRLDHGLVERALRGAVV